MEQVFDVHLFHLRTSLSLQSFQITQSTSVLFFPSRKKRGKILIMTPTSFKVFFFNVPHPACRFQFFLDKVLPQYRDSVMSHTLIYIPSYFDFVRLRNYMKKEELNFASICEYSSKSEVSRARHFFQKGDKQFLLFTERFHFYKRSVLCNVWW